MDPSLRRSIEGIHSSAHQCVIEFAGAGSLALALLHEVPGSSRTILQATDRYSAASMSDLLGAAPEKFVTPQTATAMAQRAYFSAWRLGDDAKPKLGVSCTATIATDRAKRGKHRCCVAIWNEKGLMTLDLVLAKGKRDRSAEERVVAELLIGTIAKSAGVKAPQVGLIAGEKIKASKVIEPDPLLGNAKWTLIESDGERTPQRKLKGIIFCGSFNPLHFGHEAMAAAAARQTGLPLTLELTSVNADKKPIGRAELERRLAQFQGRHAVVVTHSPLFSQKAKLFPGCTFLMGYDTADRLVDHRFYQNSAAKRNQALRQMITAGCRVLVAGRLKDGQFKTLADLEVPVWASKLFIELKGFRADISASDLRDKLLH